MLWIGKNPLKSWRVKSSHSKYPDTGEPISYEIGLWGDGKITCSCLAGEMRRKCKHITQKLDELSEKYGGIFQAINYFREQNKLKKLK